MIPRLHLVTDDRVLADPRFPSRAAAAMAEGGGRVAFHLRGPRTSGRRLWELGTGLLPVVRRHEVPLLVNDRVDLACVLGAAGAHLGVRSLPPEVARRLLPPEAILGCSVHGSDEAAEVRSGSGPGGGEGWHGPDFVFAGALFPTGSHPDRRAVGPGLIEEVRSALGGVPVLGIGGVTPERVREVLSVGAHGVAVIGAVWDAPDPAVATSALLGALEG